jgi:RiboL-PSP-HEPN
MPFLPKDAARACLRRSRRYLTLAAGNLPDTKIRNDLRRSALVMSMASVDAYMHWLVFRRISEVRREGDLPKSLAKLDLPFGDLALLADATINAQRQDRHIRPWVQVKNALQRQLLKKTFQSFDEVSTAFSLAGIERGWSRVAEKLGISSEDIKLRLNNITHRRNQIVHEGDITRASRPRRLRYNKINHATVMSDVDWIEQLLKCVEKVVNEGNP